MVSFGPPPSPSPPRPPRRESRLSARGWDSNIVPDGVTGTETDPLRDRAVLLLGLGQLDLGAERLVALCRAGTLSVNVRSSRRGWHQFECESMMVILSAR